MHQHSISFIYRSYYLASRSNTDSLKLQLLTARKKEWRSTTADSLPQAVVTCQLWNTRRY